jgi:hypothetical protein
VAPYKEFKSQICDTDIDPMVKGSSNFLIAKLCSLIALWVILPQCQPSSRDSSSSSRRIDSSEQKSEINVRRSDIQGLFKTSAEFAEQRVLQGVSRGRSSCKTITSKGSAIAAGILPWPAELKEFLTDLLDELPTNSEDPKKGLRYRAFRSINSVFLVSKEVLQADDGTMAAGLACDLGETNEGILFLNEFSFVTDRIENGLKSRKTYSVIPSPHLVIKSPDNAAVTFIHEVFHALDNKFFKDPQNIQEFDLRKEITGLSWLNNREPRYRTVEGLDLVETDDGTNGPDQRSYRGCRPVNTLTLKSSEFFGLADSSPEEVANRLQTLQSKTNFIVPYTQANPSEDFAESLAVYYFGKYNASGERGFGQNGWQRREVYRDDLRKAQPRASRILQVYDTQTILSEYPLQRTKICKLASLVFNEDEDLCQESLGFTK